MVIVYDDLTSLITSVICRNEGLGRFTASLRDSLTDATMWGPVTCDENGTTSITNISLLGYAVLSVAGVIGYPLSITATWNA